MAESLLVRLLREGRHPTGGGVLCTTGDCMNCVVQADGVDYVRSCQVDAESVANVVLHPADGPPVLPAPAMLATALPAPAPGSAPAPALPESASVSVRNVHHDVVVIGGGESGRDAAAAAERDGADVVVFEADDGFEVVGVFPGPLVVVRTDHGMVHAHAQRVIVATGAAPILPVAPGAELAGLYTPAAAANLTAAGLDLGRVVTITRPPERFEPAPPDQASAGGGQVEPPRVGAVVVDRSRLRSHVRPRSLC